MAKEFRLIQTKEKIQEILNNADDDHKKIEEIQLYKIPNATIIGNPSISHGSISNFTKDNYLHLILAFDFNNEQFTVELDFTTGSDVTTHQVLIGSNNSIELFINAGQLGVKISVNGISWESTQWSATNIIKANTHYQVKLFWNKLQYIISYKTYGSGDYVNAITYTLAQQPFVQTWNIGISNVNTQTGNPFKGTVNLNKWSIYAKDELVWQGMDDAGLATRLATDLSNLDDVGVNKLDEYITNSSLSETVDVNYQATLRNADDIHGLQSKVSELETSKDLGVIVVGVPIIHGSQVSAFTANNYLMMPRIIEFGNNPWQLDFQFTTGTYVQTQQNIIDSAFGLALAVSGGKLVVALSSNGTGWNLGAHTGTNTILANTSYFVRMTFDGSKYVVAISTDRKTYTQDIVVANTASLYPVQIYIGKSPNNSHIFTGSIYLYYAVLTINNEIVWTGTLGGELKDQLYNLEQELDTLSQEVEDNSDSWGHYAKRPPVDLSVKVIEEDKIINRDGNMVTRQGWNIAEFEAERGNTYMFNPGTMDSDVCIFSEKVVREEIRNIDYKYEYNEEGAVSKATATYNGVLHSYTYTYTEEGLAIITDDATGEEIESLPLTYTASVGSYVPMTVLPANAELPLDGYCRLVSHFESDTHIIIAVSYNRENAGLLMGVKRDGTVASICSQLSTLGKRISNLSKRVEDALEGLEKLLKTI